MAELLGAIVVATAFLGVVLRDVLVAHARVVRALVPEAAADEPPDAG
jgi:hypothetical protein